MPSAARSRLNLSSPWLLALLATLLSAAVLLCGSFGLAVHQARQNETLQMNAQGERFLARLEQLFGQLRAGLDQLEQQPLRRCSPEMVSRLREVISGNRFIYEAAYVGDARACSSWSRKKTIDDRRSPDIRGPTYDYWLNTSAQPDDNLAALVLGRGDVVAAMVAPVDRGGEVGGRGRLRSQRHVGCQLRLVHHDTQQGASAIVRQAGDRVFARHPGGPFSPDGLTDRLHLRYRHSSSSRRYLLGRLMERLQFSRRVFFDSL